MFLLIFTIPVFTIKAAQDKILIEYQDQCDLES